MPEVAVETVVLAGLSLVTAVAAAGIKFAVVQVMVELHVEAPLAIVQDEAVIVPEGLALNVAVTVQFPVIAPVVYVVPDNVPLHPVAEAEYPEFGVTVNVVVAP